MSREINQWEVNQSWKVNRGDNLPEIIVNLNARYAVRLNGQLIISPLPFKYILKKLEDFQYIQIQNEQFQRIYDIETGKALQSFTIESFLDTKELNEGKAA